MMAARTHGRAGMTDEGFAVERLRACALFARADGAVLGEVARALRRRRFRRNEVIFHQGDPGDSLHIIASGAVKIALPSAEGDEAIIATLPPGDFFGELALLDGPPALALTHAPGARGEVRLDWPYTQSDLAAMIGGTRQSVNKLLSGLVDEGLISIERDTLVVGGGGAPPPRA